MIFTKHFKRFLHILFPKMCIVNYRWNNDWLECSKCGKKLGYKYEIPDYDYKYDVNNGTIICKDKESKTVISLFDPYSKYIKKEDIKINEK